MPAGAEVLCVQTQNETACLWAMVDPDEPLLKRSFCIYGTGHPVPNASQKYIGTYQIKGGALVFHCFEVV